MKYAEKLEKFINDLNEKIPFIGSQCCGSCARHTHEVSGNHKSVWFLSDDLSNKASIGVDLIISNYETNDEDIIMELAKKNNLSFYISFFRNEPTFRMGVYSKKGKQEGKVYVDGENIKNIW